MFYPPTIREDATPSSKARDAPEEIASLGAALEMISPEVPAKQSGPSEAAKIDEG